MDTRETAQTLLDAVLNIQRTMSDVQVNVSTLNERSKNFYDILDKQEARDKDYFTRIEKIEQKIVIFERDRWWLGFLSSTIGGLIMFLLSKIW